MLILWKYILNYKGEKDMIYGAYSNMIQNKNQTKQRTQLMYLHRKRGREGEGNGPRCVGILSIIPITVL